MGELQNRADPHRLDPQLSQERTEALSKILLESHDPREFFDRAFHHLKGQSPLWSLAYLARHGNFASRAHVREILIGKRAMTRAALDGLIQAFALTPAQKDYVELLFAESERSESMAPSHPSRRSLARKRQLAAARLAPKTELPSLDIFSEPDWSTVYAALGTAEHGAAISDICRRTKFTHEKSMRILRHLMSFGLVAEQGSRFLPRENHIIFEQMSAPAMIQRIFEQSLTEASQVLATQPSPERALFYSGKVCISKRQLKELQERLYEMCLKNLHEAENPEGDSVVTVLVSLFDSGDALPRENTARVVPSRKNGVGGSSLPPSQRNLDSGRKPRDD